MNSGTQALVATDTAAALAYRHELTVEELVLQVKKIHQVMDKVMRPGIEGHYGVIPGTKKPTLLKPGAELLCMLFRLAPEYEVENARDGAHLTVLSKCALRHIPTGMVWATGMGSCSTRESKYAYRRSGRVCPECSKEDTVIKGKAEYGGGWLCFAKKGGCGAKFKDGDTAIESQQTEERVANPDLPDTENTVLKISNKRSLVAAVLNATAASEVFSQDAEDFHKQEPGADGTESGDAPPPRQEPPAGGTPGQQERRPDPDLVINENQGRRLWSIANGQKWSETQVHDLIGGIPPYDVDGAGKPSPYQYRTTKEIKIGDYEDICGRLKQGPGKK